MMDPPRKSDTAGTIVSTVRMTGRRQETKRRYYVCSLVAEARSGS